jgi:hypothetical protein
MNNLKIHSYQPAPVATSSLPGQKGGRGYHHKRGCKCPLCKRRGGGDGDDDEDGDIEMGKPNTESFNFADDDEYDDLDKAEKGDAGAFVKVGGSRRRKHSKKSKKGGRARKTRRSSRKGRKHGRRTHKRR